MEHLLASIEETCLILGNLGRTKVYELINERQLEIVKVGRRTFVTTASIHNLVETLRRPSAMADRQEEAAHSKGPGK